MELRIHPSLSVPLKFVVRHVSVRIQYSTVQSSGILFGLGAVRDAVFMKHFIDVSLNFRKSRVSYKRNTSSSAVSTVAVKEIAKDATDIEPSALWSQDPAARTVNNRACKYTI